MNPTNVLISWHYPAFIDNMFFATVKLFIIIIGGIVLNLILFLSLSVLGAYQTKRCRITYTQQVIFPVRRRIAANHVEIDLL